MKKVRTASSIGLMAAFAASLCCITPLIALIAGASGVASSLAWLNPFRPYLISVAVLSLGFAWFQSLSANKAVECCVIGPCTVAKKSLLASRIFLILITAVTALITAFPLYAKALYPTPITSTAAGVNRTNIQVATFMVKGMTCIGCQEHVNSELSKVNGVVNSVTSYEKRSALVLFDGSKVTVQQLQQVIAKTGYNVTDTKLETHGSTN